jgi:hypothetical protein
MIKEGGGDGNFQDSKTYKDQKEDRKTTLDCHNILQLGKELIKGASAPSNINLSPAANDDADQKRWLISRMEKVLEAYERGFIINRDKFKAFVADQISEIQNKQNVILSVMVVVATIVVGLLATKGMFGMNENFLFALLVTTSIFMLGIYIFLSKRKSISIDKYWTIEKSFHEALTAQNFMRGFLQIRSSFVDKISIEHFCYLYSCFIIVEGGLTQHIIDEYEKATKPNNNRFSFFWSSKALEKESSLIGKFYHVIINHSKKQHENYSCKKIDIFAKCMLIAEEKQMFDNLKELANPIL